MKLVNYKLWKEKKAIEPSREFRSALWNKLDNAWQEIYQPKVFWYQMPVFKYSLATLVVLIFVSTTGVGAYAYNSPKVTEGTRLYGIKKTIERVEEKVVERRRPEVQAKFYLKQIERREAEKVVVERRKAHEVQLQKTEEKIDRTEKQLEIVNQALLDASTTVKDTKVIEQVKKRLETRKERIEVKIEKAKEKSEEIQQKLDGNNEEIKNLIINPQPYEKSNHGVSGDGSSVGNGNASPSQTTIEASKADRQSAWGRIKHIFNSSASSSKVRASAGVNSR